MITKKKKTKKELLLNIVKKRIRELNAELTKLDTKHPALSSENYINRLEQWEYDYTYCEDILKLNTKIRDVLNPTILKEVLND